jgi:hypothetical protein
MVDGPLVVLSRSSYLGQGWDDGLDESLAPWLYRSIYSSRIERGHGGVRATIAFGASLAGQSLEQKYEKWVLEALKRQSPINQRRDE